MYKRRAKMHDVGIKIKVMELFIEFNSSKARHIFYSHFKMN
jgi:hypothetical protein